MKKSIAVHSEKNKSLKKIKNIPVLMEIKKGVKNNKTNYIYL